MEHKLQLGALVCFLMLLSTITYGQGTMADYERAASLRDKYQELAINVPERSVWIENTDHFWYRKTVKGGHEFVWVDAATLVKKTAFDHEKLAASLSLATSEKYTALKLPFTIIEFIENEKTIEFQVVDDRWRCDLTDYTIKKVQRGGAGEQESATQRRDGRIFNGLPGPRYDFPQIQVKLSPNSKWKAFVNNYNIYISPNNKLTDKNEMIALSVDGSEGNYYSLASLVWSPDSKSIAVYRIRRGYNRKIQYVESSPTDQLQPKYLTIDYAKPGDELDIPQPVLLNIETKSQFIIDNALFPNPYQLSRIEWRKDSRGFIFEYNQRGHQIYRVIEVNAMTSNPRSVISEEPKTFFCYSGKKYRHDLSDGKEIVWMSERDGWNHLYLFDGVTGVVKNQITKGPWVVRGVNKVDETKRQIWFHASGMSPGKDPYFIHYYRINFDGTGLVALTDADANHQVSFSSNMEYYIDTWSRVDLPTVSELRLIDDKKVIKELEQADTTELLKAGWRAPEVFTSYARDGQTEIWGIIYRPSNFDQHKKYPVIEYIYAGPHSSFVPKTFSSYSQLQSLAELGFIVVQIDGMGTSNRSKSFHDVAWKNLGDAGFPDRILWHKAVAAKYPYYDITRVGIYGNSAGGQSSLGGMLFHPDFYKVCISSCGCHDNRMDKIWWNEQWMGWPLGPHYAAASNVDNAYKLQGKLLLVVGEMDNNVDPASTMQVVNALIKNDKVFDLLVIPGGGHGPGGAYGEKKRNDFFVHHLLGVEPPDWNKMQKALKIEN